MYSALLLIQYLSIPVIWVGMTIVFYSKQSRIQLLLFHILFCNLINQVATLLYMKAKTMEGSLISLKLAYVGKIYIVLLLFTFILLYCGVRLNRLLLGGLVLLHTVILVMVWNSEDNHLFYSEMNYVQDGLYPHLDVKAGPFYYVFILLMVAYTLAMVAFCIYKIRMNTLKEQKARYLILLSIPVIALASFGLFKLGVTGIYDCTTLAYLIDTLILIYGMSRYELVEIVSEAKDYIIDDFSDAVLVVNIENQVVYYNKQFVNLIPDVKEHAGVPTRNMLEEIYNGEKEFWINDRLYLVRKENITTKASTIEGAIYVLTDNTADYKLTYLDPLAQVGNRRAMMRDLESFEYGPHSYLTIMDIDNFKKINDTNGHLKGDDCIVLFAETLSENFGEENVYRFGGDEFVVLSNLPEEELTRRLDNVNEGLNSNENELPFHISGGYVKIEKDGNLTEEIKRADDALYRVKRSGKGRFEGAWDA